MHSSIQRNGTAIVLTPEGSFASAMVADLRSDLLAAIEAGGRELTVNLAQCTMIDSSGLGLLIAAHNTLKKVGGQLTVTGSTPEIRNLFKLMRLDQHFPVA